MPRSRILSIDVKKKTGDTFDTILQLPPKIIPDAKIDDDGWWSFTGPRGQSKLKFNENKSLGILDHKFIDEESVWHVPMRIVPNGTHSEILITLNKPNGLTDEQFNQRVDEVGEIFNRMKQIIESS